MWTRSAKQADGTFGITVWGSDGQVYLEAQGFSTAGEADKAAEMAQREALFGKPDCTLDDIFAEMDDAELLAELGG